MIRPLSEDELPQLYAIREVAFLDWTDYSVAENQQIHLDRLKYRYGSFDGDRLVATASWYPFNMFLYGRPQTVWGLASVCTAGEARRQGHTGRLLDAGLAMMNRQGVSWCLEYPFDTRFYRRWGWETVANGTFIEVPACRLKHQRTDARRVDLDDPAGMRALQRIYEAWGTRYNFAFVRDHTIQESWRHIFGQAVWDDPSVRRFGYVMEDAYCVIALNRRDDRLIVLDYGHSSPAGWARLLALWGGFDGQITKVRFQLPDDAPLRMEWSEFVVPHPHPLHARVVNAQAALSKIPCAEFFSMVLEVSDDKCEWNHGRFRVRGDGEFTQAEPTQDPPDAKVDIRGLARVLSGSTAVDAAMFYGEYDLLTEKGGDLAKAHTGQCHMALADYF